MTARRSTGYVTPPSRDHEAPRRRARLAFRAWRKSPTFTAIAILSIALGLGANAAIFTLVDQVLLRVLPVRASHELVQFTFIGSHYGNTWGDGSELSYPMDIPSTRALRV